MLETVYWDAGTARLLPRLLRGRARGPVFVTHRRPGPGKVIAPRDVCPDTGLARLSYGQARALLDAHTSVGGARARARAGTCSRRGTADGEALQAGDAVGTRPLSQGPDSLLCPRRRP